MRAALFFLNHDFFPPGFPHKIFNDAALQVQYGIMFHVPSLCFHKTIVR